MLRVGSGARAAGRWGALLALVALGSLAGLLLVRQPQPPQPTTPLFNPFARLEDPFESYSELSLEVMRGAESQGSSSPESRRDEAPAVGAHRKAMMKQPVLGEIPTKGARPLFGRQHEGGDVVFALACKYPKLFYERFVGSLRKANFSGDIVLAVSPVQKMKPGVEDYVRRTGVVAYGFEVECQGKDNCRLLDEFLGSPDPRPLRTFANIRYALYEYWLQFYSPASYILILDFRDTYFQRNPFDELPPLPQRRPTYDLRLFAENWKVKKLGTCRYNGWWIRKCFAKEAIVPIFDNAVICSGSTMGSYDAVSYYVSVMLRSMDTVQCWRKGIESDQGYQNYLFYNGFFDAPDGSANATLFHQGNGVVNTIGAMNGFRVPKDQKGPLDTFWKIRDMEGFVLNNDGTRSACVHQWDRFYSELQPFIDKNAY